MVGAALRDLGSEDQPRLAVHRQLAVVALLEARRGLHDSAFWICEVVLLFLRRLAECPFRLTLLAMGRGLLTTCRTILRGLARPQPLDRFLDFAQTLLAPLQLLGEFIARVVRAVLSIF